MRGREAEEEGGEWVITHLLSGRTQEKRMARLTFGVSEGRLAFGLCLCARCLSRCAGAYCSRLWCSKRSGAGAVEPDERRWHGKE